MTTDRPDLHDIILSLDGVADKLSVCSIAASALGQDSVSGVVMEAVREVKVIAGQVKENADLAAAGISESAEQAAAA